MGLSLYAVSKDYHYDEELDDYVGEKGCLSTDIGYFGYKFFRDDLIEYCTSGKYESIEKVFKVFGCYSDTETYKIAVIEGDFEEQELQDEMVQKYLTEGCEIVYGVRTARDTDTFLKRTTAEGFYKVMKMQNKNLLNQT